MNIVDEVAVLEEGFLTKYVKYDHLVQAITPLGIAVIVGAGPLALQQAHVFESTKTHARASRPSVILISLK